MRLTCIIGIAAFAAVTAVAQKVFEPPHLGGERQVKAQQALTPSTDPAALYSSRHEAAVAALKAANQAASKKASKDRVINLLLIAAKRDPAYGKALYNLGLICAMSERWDDSIAFYKEVSQVDHDPEIAKLAASELERVQLLASLESTAEGKRRRLFDTDFLEVLKNSQDSVLALESLKRLTKKDASRWEAQALRGTLEASLGHYAESSKALDAASRLAPAARRSALLSSAELAKREAMFEDLLANADLTWEKQEYEPAAKLYASAWELSPGRAQVGMQSATAFLMADQIPLAVQTLARLRQIGPPEYSQKAAAMLKELSAISSDATRMGTGEGTGPAEAPIPDLAKHIAKLVGDLTSPQMRLAVKPAPALLEDATPFISLGDRDTDLSAPEVGYLSTESIFALYRKNVEVAAPAQPPTETPAPVVPPEVEQPAAPPPARPVKPMPRPEPLSSAGGVPVTSQPPGAIAIFDNDPSTACTTPCQAPLRSGRHDMKASLAGYREVLKILNVERNMSTPPLDWVFEPKQGIAYITSGQPGSAIYVDGQKTDKVTPARITLKEGEHIIGVQFEGAIVEKVQSIKDGDGVQLSLGSKP